MPNPLSLEELEELERLEAAGREARNDLPWFVARPGTYPEEEGSKIQAQPLPNSRGHMVGFYAAQFVKPENAALIAALRNAAPRLIAAAREVRQERLNADAESSLREELEDKLQGLRARVAVLEEALLDIESWLSVPTGPDEAKVARQRARAALSGDPA